MDKKEFEHERNKIIREYINGQITLKDAIFDLGELRYELEKPRKTDK